MRRWLCLMGLLSFSVQAQDQTNTWKGASDRDWFNPVNWSLGVIPADGMAVLVTNPGGNQLLLTNPTPMLGGLVLSNSSLTCSNWFTAINATNLAILNKGQITLPYPFIYTNDLTGLASNRVRIVCSNLLIEAGGEINADARGYLVANGPARGGGSGGSNNTGGGGHGGRGGDEGGGTFGPECDITNAPQAPGSGAGRWSSSPYPTTNGCGGGVIRIEAGQVMVNGAIHARGSLGAPYDGGGAGGAVYITCGSFGGTGGVIRADGGEGGQYYAGGGGGGGRIALDYASLIDNPTVRFTAVPGSLFTTFPAGMGSLWLPNLALISTTTVTRLFDQVRLIVPNWTSWAVDGLTFTNTAVCFGENGFTLTVTNDLTVRSNGWLTVGGKALSSRQTIGDAGGRTTNQPVVTVNGKLILQGGALSIGGLGQETVSRLTVGGDLVLTNSGNASGQLFLVSGWTNVLLGLTNAAFLTVGGALQIYSNGWLYPYSHPTNGGSPLLKGGAVAIRAGGGINANAAGFRSYASISYGPGAGVSSGSRGGGGGYGGNGGRGDNASSLGGTTNGHPYRPFNVGSSGGFGHSPQPGYATGGGLIRLDATALTLDGTLSANGSASASQYGGGGSGGGLFIFCDSFTGGVSGLIRANAGNGGGNGGGGGGGRVAMAVGFSESDRTLLLSGGTPANLNVFTNWYQYSGGLQVNGGTAWSNGSPGTLAFLQVAATRTVFIAGLPGNYGVPYPNPYGYALAIPDGAWFTNTVSTPADESNGTRRACLGWREELASGSFVAQSASTQAVFQVTNSLNLTWLWTNEYQLTVNADPGGSVNTASNGWHRNDAVAGGLWAAPDPGYGFLCWTGDVPAENQLDNPLAVTMAQPRSIQAYFYDISGVSRVWTGNGLWFGNPTNWTPNGIPGPMDTIEIRSGQVILDVSATVDSLLVSNGATLVFSNWNTALTVSQGITVKSNATVTQAGPFSFPAQMSNRVNIACGNLTVDRFGKIDVSALGCLSATGPGRGYGGGSNDGTGAGHGGRGGSNSSFTAIQAGGTYGSSNAPTGPGSGGGGGHTADGFQGRGGGTILIQAGGAVTVDGTLRADAQSGGSYWGGGSGGSILVLADTFSGATSAVVSARGGDRGAGYAQLGGGGGGRIALGRRFSAAHRASLLAGTLSKLIYEGGFPAYLGSTNAAGGAGGQNGQPGTLVFMKPAPPSGTVVLIQ